MRYSIRFRNKLKIYNTLIIACYSAIYKTYFLTNYAINGTLKPDFVKKVYDS